MMVVVGLKSGLACTIHAQVPDLSDHCFRAS